MSPAAAEFDLEGFLKNLPTLPGVYRMLNDRRDVIYVGKARSLKARVTSYFRGTPASPKVRVLVNHIETIEITVTNTEAEALILENNLIKKLKPRYNVTLRDDKSYPYIRLNEGEFPRLSFYRGSKNAAGEFFGPYPSAGAVRQTLNVLQRVFLLRQCEDSFFRNRSRPCLQYQIKRCSAPCTGLIGQEDYRADVQSAVLFLQGKSDEAAEKLVNRMETAATELRYEQASVYRDQITRLRQVQARQYVSGERGDLDIIACVLRGGEASVHVFFVRGGHILGSKNHFPRIPKEESQRSVLSAFIGQYYLGREVPEEILVNVEPEDGALLSSALETQVQHRVAISHSVRGERARWLAMAQRNAEHALTSKLSGKASLQARFEALQEALSLDFMPSRLECFDVSHTSGEATVASCVVFDSEGPRKSDYRRYNIRDVTAGDDYAAMHQALSRRYTRLRKEEAKLPDILFIDGGKGQVKQAIDVLEELQVTDTLIVGVAKGPDRRAGLEVLHVVGKSDAVIVLPSNSPGLHLVQQIRDEAHRFAITGHRQRRAKARTTSVLEEIPGIGHKRRQSLLKQFGGLRQLSRAGIEDIARVEGISSDLARRIYDAFH